MAVYAVRHAPDADWRNGVDDVPQGDHAEASGNATDNERDQQATTPPLPLGAARLQKVAYRQRRLAKFPRTRKGNGERKNAVGTSGAVSNATRKRKRNDEDGTHLNRTPLTQCIR